MSAQQVRRAAVVKEVQGEIARMAADASSLRAMSNDIMQASTMLSATLQTIQDHILDGIAPPVLSTHSADGLREVANSLLPNLARFEEVQRFLDGIGEATRQFPPVLVKTNVVSIYTSAPPTPRLLSDMREMLENAVSNADGFAQRLSSMEVDQDSVWNMSAGYAYYTMLQVPNLIKVYSNAMAVWLKALADSANASAAKIEGVASSINIDTATVKQMNTWKAALPIALPVVNVAERIQLWQAVRNAINGKRAALGISITPGQIDVGVSPQGAAIIFALCAVSFWLGRRSRVA